MPLKANDIPQNFGDTKVIKTKKMVQVCNKEKVIAL
jgi:hypothetical protein